MARPLPAPLRRLGALPASLRGTRTLPARLRGARILPGWLRRTPALPGLRRSRPALPGVLRPERAGSRGRATWLTVVGLVLVPLVVGGLLTWALWKPTERLDRMQAAVVNEDTPVEVDGQTVPLGRQLASALVTSSGPDADGSQDDEPDAADADGDAAEEADAVEADPGTDDDAPNVSGSDSSGNFRWVLTDAEDAEAGLADGTYATVVTIPPEFSAAATSYSGDAADAVRATVDIATSQRARLVDGAVAQAVTSTAVELLNEQLTATYLDNVYLGFTTLGEGLATAAAGAEGLAGGAQELGAGAQELATGTASLAAGLDELGSGAEDLADGVDQLADGADRLADGLDDLARGTAAQATVPDTRPFTSGLDALATGVNGPGGLAEGTAALASGSEQLSASVAQLLRDLDAQAAVCAGGTPAAPAACATMLATVRSAAGTAPPAAGQSNVVGAATNLATGARALSNAVNVGTPVQPSLAISVTQLADGGRQVAEGLTAATSGLGTLAGFVEDSADGAADLADGARDAADGASDLAAGAQEAATGADELATGAQGVADGVSGVAVGAQELATGLDTAVEEVPAYTDEEATALAGVVAAPVTAEGQDTAELFGATSVPFLSALALWLGGLATSVVLTAVPRRTLGSTRSSAALAARAFVPVAVVGAVQGAVMTAVMAFALDLSPGGWATFTAVAVLAGVAFAAVNQGLVAVLGGAGRFLAVVVAVVGLATAIVSTVPRALEAVFGGLPLAPALEGLQGVVTGDGGVGGAVAALVVWGLVGMAATTAAIARTRVVPAARLARGQGLATAS